VKLEFEGAKGGSAVTVSSLYQARPPPWHLRLQVGTLAVNRDGDRDRDRDGDMPAVRVSVQVPVLASLFGDIRNSPRVLHVR